MLERAEEKSTRDGLPAACRLGQAYRAAGSAAMIGGRAGKSSAPHLFGLFRLRVLDAGAQPGPDGADFETSVFRARSGGSAGSGSETALPVSAER